MSPVTDRRRAYHCLFHFIPLSCLTHHSDPSSAGKRFVFVWLPWRRTYENRSRCWPCGFLSPVTFTSHCGLVHQSHGLSSLGTAPERWTLFDAAKTGFLRQPQERAKCTEEMRKPAPRGQALGSQPPASIQADPTPHAPPLPPVLWPQSACVLPVSEAPDFAEPQVLRE